MGNRLQCEEGPKCSVSLDIIIENLFQGHDRATKISPEVLNLPSHKVLNLQIILASIVSLVDGPRVDLPISLPVAVVAIRSLMFSSQNLDF